MASNRKRHSGAEHWTGPREAEDNDSSQKKNGGFLRNLLSCTKKQRRPKLRSGVDSMSSFLGNRVEVSESSDAPVSGQVMPSPSPPHHQSRAEKHTARNQDEMWEETEHAPGNVPSSIHPVSSQISIRAAASPIRFGLPPKPGTQESSPSVASVELNRESSEDLSPLSSALLDIEMESSYTTPVTESEIRIVDQESPSGNLFEAFYTNKPLSRVEEEAETGDNVGEAAEDRGNPFAAFYTPVSRRTAHKKSRDDWTTEESMDMKKHETLTFGRGTGYFHLHDDCGSESFQAGTDNNADEDNPVIFSRSSDDRSCQIGRPQGKEHKMMAESQQSSFIAPRFEGLHIGSSGQWKTHEKEAEGAKAHKVDQQRTESKEKDTSERGFVECRDAEDSGQEISDGEGSEEEDSGNDPCIIEEEELDSHPSSVGDSEPGGAGQTAPRTKGQSLGVFNGFQEDENPDELYERGEIELDTIWENGDGGEETREEDDDDNGFDQQSQCAQEWEDENEFVEEFQEDENTFDEESQEAENGFDEESEEAENEFDETYPGDESEGLEDQEEFQENGEEYQVDDNGLDEEYQADEEEFLGNGEEFQEDEDGVYEEYPEDEDEAGEEFPEDDDGVYEENPQDEDRTGEEFPEDEDGVAEEFPVDEDGIDEEYPEDEDGVGGQDFSENQNGIDEEFPEEENELEEDENGIREEEEFRGEEGSYYCNGGEENSDQDNCVETEEGTTTASIPDTDIVETDPEEDQNIASGHTKGNFGFSAAHYGKQYQHSSFEEMEENGVQNSAVDSIESIAKNSSALSFGGCSFHTAFTEDYQNPDLEPNFGLETASETEEAEANETLKDTEFTGENGGDLGDYEEMEGSFENGEHQESEDCGYGIGSFIEHKNSERDYGNMDVSVGSGDNGEEQVQGSFDDDAEGNHQEFEDETFQDKDSVSDYLDAIAETEEKEIFEDGGGDNFSGRGKHQKKQARPAQHGSCTEWNRRGKTDDEKGGGGARRTSTPLRGVRHHPVEVVHGDGRGSPTFGVGRGRVYRLARHFSRIAKENQGFLNQNK